MAHGGRRFRLALGRSLLVAALAALAGCDEGSAALPEPASPPDPAVVATSGASEAVAKALAAARAAGPLAFRYRTSIPPTLESSAHGIVRYDPALAMTLVIDTLSLGGGGIDLPFEQIVADGTLYTRGYSGQRDTLWRAEPGTHPVAAFIFQDAYFGFPGSPADPFLQVGELLAGASVGRVGPAKLGKVATTRYTGEFTSRALAARPTVPADVRKRLRQLFEYEGVPWVRFDVWADRAGLARQVKIEVGVGEGNASYTYRTGAGPILVPRKAELSPTPGAASPDGPE